MISPKRWMMSLGLLVAGVGLVLVLSQPKPSPETGGAPAATTATPNVEHSPMNPLNVQADDPSSLEAALEKIPGHSPILMRMAELARDQGDLGEAVKHLRQAVEAEPTNMDARLELGRALYESGDTENAIQETSRILDRDSNHVDALYNLGAIHANQNQPGRASEYWSRAVAVGPASESGLNARRGLDILDGRVPVGNPTRSEAIPDIPEHQDVRRAGRPASGDPKRALIEFATKQ